MPSALFRTAPADRPALARARCNIGSRRGHLHLAHDSAEPLGRLILAGGFLLGFLSHLLLDEIYSVDARGLRIRKSSGSAFKLFTREVIEKIVPQLESGAAFVSAELLIRAKLAGYRIVEVGVPHHPRTAGRPKGAPPKVILRTIGELFRLRRSLRSLPARAPDGTSTGDRQ